MTRAVDEFATLFKDGFIPPSSINWNDADDNNAFHAKLCVMDFDGTLSTELAMLKTQAEAYDTRGHHASSAAEQRRQADGLPVRHQLR